MNENSFIRHLKISINLFSLENQESVINISDKYLNM